MWRAIFLSAVLIGTAHADDPFACVDPDVASAFLGNPYGGDGGYSTEIPDDFVELNVPPELVLIGSQSLDTHSSVVFKSEHSADKALRETVSAMAEIGWVEETNAYRRRVGGFQAASRPSHANICHIEKREALAVTATKIAGSSFVSLVQYAHQHGCGFGANLQATLDPRAIRAYMPTISMPDDAEVSSMGSGGNGYEVNSRADIETGLNRAELVVFFEDQIRDQGWEAQSSWSGAHSSGSVWIRTVDGIGMIIGTLHLIEPENGPVRARFDAVPASDDGGFGYSNGSLASG